MKIKNNAKLMQLVTDLYWDFDRLTSSGQETLEKLAKMVGVPTEEEMNNTTLYHKDAHLEDMDVVSIDEIMKGVE